MRTYGRPIEEQGRVKVFLCYLGARGWQSKNVGQRVANLDSRKSGIGGSSKIVEQEAGDGNQEEDCDTCMSSPLDKFQALTIQWLSSPFSFLDWKQETNCSSSVSRLKVTGSQAGCSCFSPLPCLLHTTHRKSLIVITFSHGNWLILLPDISLLKSSKSLKCEDSHRISASAIESVISNLGREGGGRTKQESGTQV